MLPEEYHDSVGKRLEVVVSMNLAASYFTEGNFAKHLHNTIKISTPSAQVELSLILQLKVFPKTKTFFIIGSLPAFRSQHR